MLNTLPIRTVSSEIFCYQAQKGGKEGFLLFNSTWFQKSVWNKKNHSIAICKGSGLSVKSLSACPNDFVW